FAARVDRSQNHFGTAGAADSQESRRARAASLRKGVESDKGAFVGDQADGVVEILNGLSDFQRPGDQIDSRLGVNRKWSTQAQPTAAGAVKECRSSQNDEGAPTRSRDRIRERLQPACGGFRSGRVRFRLI